MTLSEIKASLEGCKEYLNRAEKEPRTKLEYDLIYAVRNLAAAVEGLVKIEDERHRDRSWDVEQARAAAAYEVEK